MAGDCSAVSLERPEEDIRVSIRTLTRRLKLQLGEFALLMKNNQQGGDREENTQRGKKSENQVMRVQLSLSRRQAESRSRIESKESNEA